MQNILRRFLGLVGIISLLTRFFLIFSSDGEPSGRSDLYLIVLGVSVILYNVSAFSVLGNMLFGRKSNGQVFETFLITWIILMTAFFSEQGISALYYLDVTEKYSLTWIMMAIATPMFVLYEKLVFGSTE